MWPLRPVVLALALLAPQQPESCLTTPIEPLPRVRGSMRIDPFCYGRSPRSPDPVVLERDVVDALVNTEAAVITSDAVLRGAADALEVKVGTDGSALDDLRLATRVSRRDDTLVLEVGVRDPEGKRAAETCNAILDAYVEFSRSDRARPWNESIARIDAELTTLNERREKMRSRLGTIAAQQADEEPEEPRGDATGERRRLERSLVELANQLDRLQQEREQLEWSRSSLPTPVEILDRCRARRP